MCRGSEHQLKGMRAVEICSLAPWVELNENCLPILKAVRYFTLRFCEDADYFFFMRKVMCTSE